jgi:hypothetical protein
VLGAICSSSDERQTAEEEKLLPDEIEGKSEKERADNMQNRST